MLPLIDLYQKRSLTRVGDSEITKSHQRGHKMTLVTSNAPVKWTQSQQLQPHHQRRHQNDQHDRVNWRELTLRRRLTVDCQIIACIVTSGSAVLITGIAMYVSAKLALGGDSVLLLIGPVLAGCGVIILLLSVEVCLRRYRTSIQAEDLSSDEDEADDVDSGLVNYAFGNYQPEHLTSMASLTPVQQVSNDSYVPSFQVEEQKSRLHPELFVHESSPQHNTVYQSDDHIEMLIMRQNEPSKLKPPP